MSLKIEHLYKSYGDLCLFKDFNLSFEEGRITCILGPSGCGKTTLLNIIGGLEKADSGTFSGWEGLTFSYIFQETRLLPWKTVRGNIEFVLDRTLPATQRRNLANNLMQRVALDAFANYYPAQLSGGMRQRVAIARSFAVPSQVILMDEPLTGLDQALKQTLLDWFKQLWEDDRRTVIYVTHSAEEAAYIGDRSLTL